MQKSLTENELRNLGRNQLQPQGNTLHGQNPFVSYGQNQNYQNGRNQLPGFSQNEGGFLGMKYDPKSPSRMLGFDADYRESDMRANFAGEDFGRSYQQIRGRPGQQPTSKIELSRMMRCEREEQMMHHEKMHQKFENFNKLMRGGDSQI